MTERMSNRGYLAAIFSITAGVGAAHYGISGMEDAVVSAKAGIHAGWGALALDFFRSVALGHPDKPPDAEFPSPAGRQP